MPGKKIGDLNAYGSINTDTSRRSRLEIDRNSGTYSSPIYGPDDSCKITLEELKEALNIKEYLVNEVIGKTNGDTLEVDKINVLNLTSNATFTLPTASIAYKGKALIIIQSNVNNYKAVINGAAQGPINISDFRDAIIFNCVFDGTSSYDWFAISKDDSKICNRLVVVSSSTYTANANDNIQANAQSLGSDIDITIPTAGIEGRLIYAYYPTGSPSAFVVELIGGFTATLNQGDYFLIRDNGSYWEAISTSQNTATTPNLDTVTGEGSTTTNSIEVGGLVVDMPSGSGVATSITKGGEGEALTVNKTSGSGNVASFNNGTTLVKDLEVSTATASTPTFFSSAKKIISATGALLGTWFQTLTAKSTPVNADTIIVNDSASSFEAKKTTLTELWTNYLLGKVQALGYLVGSGLTTNNTLKWNGSQLVNANETDDGTTITSTLNRVFTGASANSNGSGINSNKFLFDGNNTSASASGSFIQVAPQMQIPAGSIGGSLRGILYLDASANTYVNNGYTQLFLNSGGDLINSKISLRRAIYINHRSSDNINNANHNSSAVTIDATMYRPQISAVSTGSSGVHHITSVNADNYSSIIQDGASGQRPVNYSAYSLRADAIGFSNGKNISASSGVQNGNINIISTTNTSYSSGFGFSVVNRIANSNASPQIVNLQEEYIVANAGAGTSNAGKRYRHVNDNQGAASAYIMGLYRTGVIIGDTTALPNSNASLHLQSTSKGFLPNVLTTAQRDAVSWVAGDAGMIIYNSTTNKHQGWNGTTWNDMY